MLRSYIPLAAAIMIPTNVAAAPGQTGGTSATPERVICKKVVSAEAGTKPYDMCMTKTEWTAKKVADAKDPNRIVCRYEESSTTRFRSYKVCMTAAEWTNQRQLERAAIEKLQSTTCVLGGGC